MESQTRNNTLPKEYHPLWLLLTVSLPVTLTLIFFSSLYLRIRSLFDKEESVLWLVLGAVLLVYAALSCLYGITQWINKSTISPWTGIPALIVNMGFLIYAVTNFESIIPSNVPLWMYMGDNYVLYLIALMMPGFAYGMGMILLWLTPKNKKQSIPLNLAVSVGIPLFWLLVVKVIIPVINKWINPDSILYRLDRHLSRMGSLILIVASAAAFIFFLIRVFVLISRQYPKFFKTYLKVPVVLVFPLIGLLLNNGVFKGGKLPDFVFGDFSHIIYYLLATVTGVVLILPPRESKLYTQILLYAKLFLIPYSVYFFIIFLPWLPLTIPAVLFFGAGLLMMAPTGLMIYHIRSIKEDLYTLGSSFLSKKSIIFMVLMVLVIPLAVISNMYRDKVMLYRALDNIYRPDYMSKTSRPVSPKRIYKALQHAEKNERTDWLESNLNTPIITPVFNLIVFGHQDLSKKKKDLLAAIYLGHKYYSSPKIEKFISPTDIIDYSDIKTFSAYDPQKGVWTSKLRLFIKNKSKFQQEFNSILKLSSGAYVTDFKLKIGDVLKSGILSEKKAAVWVYNEITRPRTLDPAILYYINNNELQMRIFPFVAGQERYAEMEITHVQPFDLVIGNRVFKLGQGTRYRQNSPYLDQDAIDRLPLSKRALKYNFVVDTSYSASNKIERYIDTIQDYIHRHNLDKDSYNIIQADNTFQYLENTKDWKESLLKHTHQGGFYAGQVIRHILVNNYFESSDMADVILLVSDEPEHAIYSHDLSLYRYLTPDLPGFYHLNSKGELALNTWADQMHSKTVTVIQSTPVKILMRRDGSKSYVPKNISGPHLIFDPRILMDNKKLLASVNRNLIKDDKGIYETELLEQLYTIVPLRGNRLINTMIFSSMSSGIMNTLTSYIVLENEAQEKALLEKQNRILSGKQELDAGGEEQRNEMSEPSSLILLALSAILIYLQLRRRKKLTAT